MVSLAHREKRNVGIKPPDKTYNCKLLLPRAPASLSQCPVSWDKETETDGRTDGRTRPVMRPIRPAAQQAVEQADMKFRLDSLTTSPQSRLKLFTCYAVDLLCDESTTDRSSGISACLRVCVVLRRSDDTRMQANCIRHAAMTSRAPACSLSHYLGLPQLSCC